MGDAGEKDKNWCIVILKFSYQYWRTLFMMLWPLISMWVFVIGFDKKIRCLYVVHIMAGYWVSECIPLYVTGLLPVALMPLLSIVDSKPICTQYLNSTNMLFIAGLVLAISIENSGLHMRIALCTLLCLGCSPRRLHLGITVVTTFISLWIVNTAAAAMMCPIIAAVLDELENNNILKVHAEPGPKDSPDDPPYPSNISKAMYLTAGWAATIGGCGTLVGTGTNLTYKGLFEEAFPTGDTIDFVPWMLFNIPCVIVQTIGMWFIVEILLMGLFRPKSAEYAIIKTGNENKDIIRNVIRGKLKDLGPMKWHEISVLILFLTCCFMWIFRKPQGLKGWTEYYDRPESITDSAFPFVILFLFLALPATCEWVQFCKLEKKDRPTKMAKAVLPWDVINRKFPWGFLFLLGGGFALSYSGSVSGMSKFLGSKLVGLQRLNSWSILAITSFIAAMTTELTSNVALANILIPVLIDMSVGMEIHPALYTLPAAVNCSYAFMLPVGTPANAIIVGASNVKTIDMMKYGFLVKLVCWGAVTALFPTYGTLFYDLNKTPDWIYEVTESPGRMQNFSL